MGVSLTPEERAQVEERASFAYMKAHEPQFAPPKLPFTRSQGVMIRSGKVGASGELLSPEQQARIDDDTRQALAELGSDFRYDTFFQP